MKDHPMFPICTDFLTVTSTPLTGIGSLLAFSGPYYSYNASATAEEADHKAIMMDWRMVGSDIQSVMPITPEKLAEVQLSLNLSS